MGIDWEYYCDAARAQRDEAIAERAAARALCAEAAKVIRARTPAVFWMGDGDSPEMDLAMRLEAVAK